MPPDRLGGARRERAERVQDERHLREELAISVVHGDAGPDPFAREPNRVVPPGGGDETDEVAQGADSGLG